MFHWKTLTYFRDRETEAQGKIMTCPRSYNITRLEIKCLVPRSMFFVKEPKTCENRRVVWGGGTDKRSMLVGVA